MENYCLRRTELCLSLPTSHEINVPLCFSPAERSIYDQILDETRRQIDDIVSTGEKGRCTKLFMALLRMRIICNMGTFPITRAVGFSMTSSQMGLPSSVKNDCERCSAPDEDTFMLLSTCEVCPDCMRPLHQQSPSLLPRGHFNQTSEAENTSTMINGAINSRGISESPFKQDVFSTKLAAVVQNVVNTSGSENKEWVLPSIFPSDSYSDEITDAILILFPQ